MERCPIGERALENAPDFALRRYDSYDTPLTPAVACPKSRG
jgi:hypothetical protein